MYILQNSDVSITAKLLISPKCIADINILRKPESSVAVTVNAGAA